MNDFSNSESLQHSDAFHQVLAPSDLDFLSERILVILNLQVTPLLSTKL